MLPSPRSISANLVIPIIPFLVRKTIPEAPCLLLSTDRYGNGKSNLVPHLIARLFFARVHDQFDPPESSELLQTGQALISAEVSESSPPELADPPPLSPGPNPGPEFPRPPMPSPPAPDIPFPVPGKPPPDKLPPLPRPDIMPPTPLEVLPPPSIPPNILPPIGSFGSFTFWEF